MSSCFTQLGGGKVVGLEDDEDSLDGDRAAAGGSAAATSSASTTVGPAVSTRSAELDRETQTEN